VEHKVGGDLFGVKFEIFFNRNQLVVTTEKLFKLGGFRIRLEGK
jgi:hypothetical protein